MYLSRDINVIINSANFKHYRQFNKNIKCKNIYIFDIDNLTKSSSALINIKCDICDIEKELKYKDYKSYGYSNGDYYCKKCKTIKTNRDLYGVDNTFQRDDIKKKITEIINEKYGVDNISQSKEIQEKKQDTYNNRTVAENNKINKKRVETTNKKYGVNNISQTKEVQKKKLETWSKKTNTEKRKIKETRENTLLKKYNTNHNFKIKEVKEQIKRTNYELYGVDNPSKNKQITEKIKTSLKITLSEKQFKNIKNLKKININTFTLFCEKCNDNYEINKLLFYKRRETKTTICTKCNSVGQHTSGKELQLLHFIESVYDGEIISSDRKILKGKELDIYLPELNLAFEFNGIYWHNELNKENDYHYNKHIKCKEQGISLFHIWEDDWNNKENIIKSMILNKLGKYNIEIETKNTEVKEITNNTIIKDFLEKNDIEGYSPSTKKIGLLYKNELISLILFKRKKDNYEILRFCNKLNYDIKGSFFKILSYFTSKHNFKNITLYSSNDYSDDSFYESLKFRKTKEIKPDYKYVSEEKRVNKTLYNKDTLELNSNRDKTEHEICLENNIFRIYDSGKLKWTL